MSDSPGQPLFPPPPSYPSGYQGGPPAGGPIWMGPSSTPTTAGRAIAALVLGLASLLLFVTLIVPVLALILGLGAAGEVKRSHGARTGLGMARTGWVLGLLGICGFGAVIAVAVVNSKGTDKETSVFALELGVCYDFPEDPSVAVATTVTSMTEIACTKPHDAEMFFEGHLNPTRDRVYPAAANALFFEAATTCTAEPFTDYVGKPFDIKKFGIFTIVPDASSWKLTKGEFNCFITAVETGGKLTQPAKGSG